jgi:type 1 glutamine amidotransferase
VVRNLILTGGIGHRFDDAAPALRDILAAGGIESEIATDLEAGIASLGEGGFDLVTVYALRWRMIGSEKYARHRADWAFSLSPAARRSLIAHVEAGRGLFGVHTASICFDDWPEWQGLLGGIWVWGRSYHPPIGPVEVRRTATRHVITEGTTDFRLMRDEVYSDLSVVPDAEPLLVASAMSAPSGTAGGAWPALWARQIGPARVVYDALGHDRGSLEHPEHRQILVRSAIWASSIES